MSKLKLFLLGSPRIERDGRRVEVERRTVIALLAYLAVTEQPHGRDTLATLFWPDTDQAHARGALRRDISVLNKALGGSRLAVEGQTVALQRSPDLWVDVVQFHNLLALCRTHGHPEAEVYPACLTPLAEAVALYQDDFLAGFTLRDSPDFDEWQFFQTESLRRELASALERLARGYSAQTQFEPAIGYARRWLLLDLLHEPAHRSLMQLYIWSGQRNAALRQYSECGRILERELGVSPETATTQLYEAIKENQAALPVVDPHLIITRAGQPTPQNNLLAYVPLTSLVRSEPKRAPFEPFFSPLDRVLRGGLVGRERELAESNTLWDQVISGEGQVLLVSGEPGIGKTRLVREFITWVEGMGAKALMGECYAEGGPPYAPIAQIIRAILGGSDAASLNLPSYILADLMTLAPDLRPRYSEVLANPPLDPPAEQQRLFESVVGWCDALAQAAHAPLLLFIEDVHWADSGTLFLLRHLARRSRSGKLRLLLVMTYREAELNAVPALNEVLLDLNRERLVKHLKLSRLNREQTHNLLAGMLATGGEISPEFLDGIYRETEGNPFFVEEVCKALIEEGKLYYFGESWRRTDMAAINLPQGVRGAILSRVEKLPTPVQETLRLAAVLGREFDFDTLQGTSDLDEEVLIVALERAERSQLIGEVHRPGRMMFAFTHALIPFTLRESVSGLRLQRLHRRVASVIEAHRPDDYEALAYHFAAAGEREQAVKYSHDAAQRAAAMYAYDVAVQHLHSALDLMEAGEQVELRMALLEQLADATYLLGEHIQAIPLYQEALNLWRGLVGADALRVTAVRLHRKIIQRVVHFPRAIDFQAFETVLQVSVSEGLQLIEGTPPHPEIVHLLTTLAYEPFLWRIRYSKDWNAAERYAHAAVDMAEQLNMPVELAAALVALSGVYAMRGLFRERVPIAHRILAICRDPHFTDVHERMGALYEASIPLVDVGEYAQALPYFQEAERLADQMRAVNEQVFALARQAQCWLRLDQWDEVLKTEEKLQAVKQRYPEFAERARTWCLYAALKAGVHALRGELDQAATWREEATGIMVAINGPPERWTRSQHY